MSAMRRLLIRTFTVGLSSAGVLGAAATLAAIACLPSPAGATPTTLPPKHVGTHAHAATTPTLSGIQTEAAAAVTNRIRILDSAMAHVSGEKDLGNGQAPLHAYLSAVVQRLQGQQNVVAADTTADQAQRDFMDVFSGFRVYHLVLPAASLAARADRVTQTGVPALKAAAAKAHRAADRRNRATVGPLVADLDRQIAAATSASQGVASTVLAYTPVQWNANNALLTTPASAVSSAEKAIRQGQVDVKHIRQDLHGTVHGGRAKPHHHTTLKNL
jgi:hypothetical protein